ncbi:MAG: hypothetical protein ACRESI_05115, partial [Gammaproteobacteria bacterium]
AVAEAADGEQLGDALQDGEQQKMQCQHEKSFLRKRRVMRGDKAFYHLLASYINSGQTLYPAPAVDDPTS